ncbi:hypothetical protein ACHWQZ_G009060 [Mnemiopsis leidyi]
MNEIARCFLLLVAYLGCLSAACPDSCCNAFTKFQIQEDKCILTKSTQKLTSKIMQEMGKSDRNVFISPNSVSNILRLLLLASEGETKRELSHALSSQAMDIHVASQCLSDRIFDSTGTETLNSTNDFFISHEYKASPKTQDYRTKAEALYRASFYNCNFVNKPDRALKRVNGIVETKSNGLIKELFSPGDINNETKLIIVNTIAFKSNWLHQFDKTKTSYDVFYVDRVTEQLTEFMEVEGDFASAWVQIPQGALQTVEVEIVEMPYESAEFSMMAIRYSGLHFGDLADIESYVADKGILTVRESLRKSPTAITFPKFRMEYDRDLSDIFTPDTGLGIVFSPRADYSKFADALYISNIIHKAVIEVTEEGTVASSASGGFFVQRSFDQRMKFDVPFVFYIYHSCDGLVLFQGRYAYPTDE